MQRNAQIVRFEKIKICRHAKRKRIESALVLLAGFGMSGCGHVADSSTARAPVGCLSAASDATDVRIPNPTMHGRPLVSVRLLPGDQDRVQIGPVCASHSPTSNEWADSLRQAGFLVEVSRWDMGGYKMRFKRNGVYGDLASVPGEDFSGMPCLFYELRFQRSSCGDRPTQWRRQWSTPYPKLTGFKLPVDYPPSSEWPDEAPENRP
ncbi:MAG: hypothetical protein JWO36_6515 [Myxococcales bacterium]|nr:hypothetical protein [Myxococcales bacterium]